MESLAAANANFSLELFKKITETNKAGNVFFSPLSISSALAMVCLGAKGNTATQMHESLNLNKSEGDIHVGFSKLFAELNKEGASYVLSLANRLYGEQSCQFEEKFLADTKKHYLAELETVDFCKNAEAARVNINKWVEQKTQEKIKDLLAKGSLKAGTRLVLVNAIYFKGNWERQFNTTETKEVPFKLNKNEVKPVEMMHQEAEFPFTNIRAANCRILELPYVGKDLSMLIMLPNKIEDNTTGLEKLEQMLTYENFTKWTRPGMMGTVKVKVGLPKFKMEGTYNLRKVLMSMGMVDAFNKKKCDLSGMSPSGDLVLSKVVHKSFVELNEEGTEAAAATAECFYYSYRWYPQERLEIFIADHPFLFFIRHNPTMSVLFYGCYRSP